MGIQSQPMNSVRVPLHTKEQTWHPLLTWHSLYSQRKFSHVLFGTSDSFYPLCPFQLWCFGFFSFLALKVISVIFIAEKQHKEKLKRWELRCYKQGILRTCCFQSISLISFTYI